MKRLHTGPDKAPLKKRNRRRRLIILPVAAVVLVALGISGCYFYVNSHIQQKIKYVDTWAQAIDAAGDTSHASSSSGSAVSSAADDDTGLAALDAGDFYKEDTKNYPIIKVKQKDPDIENILIMGIDGGDPGGVGVNRADCIMVASINRK